MEILHKKTVNKEKNNNNNDFWFEDLSSIICRVKVLNYLDASLLFEKSSQQQHQN